MDKSVKFIIGSTALSQYLDIERVPFDVDVLCSEDYIVSKHGNTEASFRKRHDIGQLHFEYDIVSDNSPYLSDKLLYIYCQSVINKLKAVLIWNELYYIAPLEVLKVLKLSCVEHLNKGKHTRDLELLKGIEISDTLTQILQIREKEVKIRVLYQKDKFFNHYQISRDLPHDFLHTLVSQTPIYEKVLIDSVTPSEELFNALSQEEKVNIVREEVMVLVVERVLVPRLKKKPLLAYYTVVELCDVNSAPVTFWFDRFAGNLKDHPTWLSQWAKDNQQIIKFDLQPWWKNTMDKVSMIICDLLVEKGCT